jgi:hypothetical protein
MIAKGDAEAPYVVQSSTDLAHWDSVSTNLMASSSIEITNNLPPGSEARIWRAVWMP